jgi:two-component system invasion response regulator UvrY
MGLKIAQMKPTHPPISVLLIDDHPVVRSGYRRLLTRADDVDVVGEADDGERGYQMFQQLLPDVTVLDLSLPGMSGLEVLRRIHMREPDAGVLIFSIHESEMIMARAISLGARGYLTKRSASALMLEACRRVALGETYIDPKFSSESGKKAELVADPTQDLTQREFQVFLALAEGLSVPVIAGRLGISPKTVGVHYTSVMKKLNLSNTAQLARLAIRLGLTEA